MPKKVAVIITEEQHVGLNADVFNSLAEKVINEASATTVSGDISLVLVSDSKIQDLNNIYRGKNVPTDVLSFSLKDASNKDIFEKTTELEDSIGEIIISVDTADRQAKEQNHKLSTEIEILFVHGLLHVLGYDHEKAADRKKMLKAEMVVLGDNAGLIKRNLGE